MMFSRIFTQKALLFFQSSFTDEKGIDDKDACKEFE